MKKLNLLFLTLAMAFSFNMSAQVDVGLTAINSPADGSTILPLGNSTFVVKKYVLLIMGVTCILLILLQEIVLKSILMNCMLPVFSVRFLATGHLIRNGLHIPKF